MMALEMGTEQKDMPEASDNGRQTSAKIKKAFTEQLERFIDVIGKQRGEEAAASVRNAIPPTAENVQIMLTQLVPEAAVNLTEELGKFVDTVHRTAADSAATSQQAVDILLKAEDSEQLKAIFSSLLGLAHTKFYNEVVSWHKGDSPRWQNAWNYWNTPGQERKYTQDISFGELFPDAPKDLPPLAREAAKPGNVGDKGDRRETRMNDTGLSIEQSAHTGARVKNAALVHDDNQARQEEQYRKRKDGDGRKPYDEDRSFLVRAPALEAALARQYIEGELKNIAAAVALDPELADQGSTATVAMTTTDGKIVVGNVGDSPAYLVVHNKQSNEIRLVQLHEEHTAAGEERRAVVEFARAQKRRFTKDQVSVFDAARKGGGKTALKRYLGMGVPYDPDNPANPGTPAVSVFDAKALTPEGFRPLGLLVGSDGICTTKSVKDIEEQEKVIAGQCRNVQGPVDMHAVAAALVNSGVKGCYDNVTAAMISLENEDAYTKPVIAAVFDGMGSRGAGVAEAGRNRLLKAVQRLRDEGWKEQLNALRADERQTLQQYARIERAGVHIRLQPSVSLKERVDLFKRAGFDEGVDFRVREKGNGKDAALLFTPEGLQRLKEASKHIETLEFGLVSYHDTRLSDTDETSIAATSPAPIDSAQVAKSWGTRMEERQNTSVPSLPPHR